MTAVELLTTSLPTLKANEMSKWLKIDDDGWQVVIPETDILPHGIPTPESPLKVELGGAACPCKPKIDWQSRIIVHNSFEDQKKIDDSLKSLTLEE